MKVAMWSVFIFFMGILGLVLINLFGNITTTNQQDYTLVRNTVEAAMYDSIDRASYRAGFYLCVKPGSYKKDSEGRIVFESKNDYDILLNHNVTDTVKSQYQQCDFLTGEIKLNADVFVESFIRRFSNSLHNNKSYQVTVQEVIEYPPKVSIRIDTYNNYGSESVDVAEFDAGDFEIRNQVDAIFEDRDKVNKN